jgi:hypothetical protein
MLRLFRIGGRGQTDQPNKDPLNTHRKTSHLRKGDDFDGGSVAGADFSDSRASPKLRHDHAGNYTKVGRAAPSLHEPKTKQAPHSFRALCRVPHLGAPWAPRTLRQGWDTATLNRGSSYSLIPSPCPSPTVHCSLSTVHCSLSTAHCPLARPGRTPLSA